MKLLINGQPKEIQELVPFLEGPGYLRDWDKTKRYWEVKGEKDLLVQDENGNYTMNLHPVTVALTD